MKNKQLNNKTLWEQNVMDISLRILILLSFIVIVFSIGSCTQNQQDGKKELKIVERVGADVSLYKFHHEYGTKRMGEVISAAEVLLEAIKNPEIQLSEDELELNLHKLTWLWLSATPTTEYAALTNSGEIGLVSSEELRRKFKEMNIDQEKLKQFEEIQVSYVNQELRPFLNRHIDRTTIDTYQKADSLITIRLPSPFENTPSDLLKNREFANILTDLIFFTKRIMLPYRRIAVVMNDMEEIIAKDYPEAKIEPYEPF
jgi:hypothetical protein